MAKREKHKMPKWKKILLIVMAVWLVVFVADFFIAIFMRRPLLAIKFSGEQADTYVGLGYFYKQVHNYTSPEGISYDNFMEYNPFIYLFTNLVLLLIVIFKRKRKPRKDKEITQQQEEM